MTDRSQVTQVTMSIETIHNPAEPRHFMRVKPVKGRARVLLGDKVLAESGRALRVLEVGRDVYDPVIYFPPRDVTVSLRERDKQTHCPLKGDCRYFDADMHGAEEIAWSYRNTLDFAEILKDLIAFDAGRVIIEESPA